MTDRYKGLSVTFKHPVRSDDAQAIINAISLLPNIIAVTPYIDEPQDHFSRLMIRSEMRDKLFKVLE